MKCEEFQELLQEELAAGPEVAPARRDDVAVHLRGCGRCRELDAAAQRLRHDLELERRVGADAARPRFRIRARPRFATAAAAAALFVVGGALGGLLTWRLAPRGADDRPAGTPPAIAPVAAGPRFLLALYERGPVGPRPPSDAAAKIVGEYVAWARALEEGGHLEIADRLRDDARAGLRIRSGRVVVDEEPPEPDELRLGGFFLITASSMDEAILLARASPHLRYGGEIEIREIDRSH